MSEYDVALDSQTEWASFWTSSAGRSTFHNYISAVVRRRQEMGEEEPSRILEDEYGEHRLSMLPILNGDTYYWSPQILDLLKPAIKSLPDTWALMRQHMPSASGFFYLGKEWDMGIKALAWSVFDAEEKALAGQGGLVAFPVSNEMIDFNGLSLIAFMQNPDTRITMPLPCRSTMFVGESLQQWKLNAVRYAVDINADIKEIESDYMAIRLFATMLAFIHQRILISFPQDASRPSRRRAEQAGRTAANSVNVIRLRAISRRSGNVSDEEIVDWTCRWIVRGHWREQWYPSLDRHQPVFINPYIKGPDDKPLKDTSRLFAVVR